MPRDEYVDTTGTLRRAQRQVEQARPQAGLRALRALEPDDLRQPEQLRFYYVRGLAYLQREDTLRAQTDLERALDLARRLHNAEAMARTTNLLGVLHRQQDRPALAVQHHRRAYQAALDGSLSDPNFTALAAGDLAAAYSALGDSTHAHTVYGEALRQAGADVAPRYLAPLHWGLSMTALTRGDLSQARSAALHALELCGEEAGHPHHTAARINYALVLEALGNHDEAIQQLHTAAGTTDPDQQATALLALTELLLRLERNEEASVAAAEAVAAAHRAGNACLHGQALMDAARAAFASDDSDAALVHYEQALSVLRPAGHPRLLADALFALACLLTGLKRPDRALRYYEEACELGNLSPPVPTPHLRPPPAGPGFTPQPATAGERRAGHSARVAAEAAAREPDPRPLPPEPGYQGPYPIHPSAGPQVHSPSR